MFKRLVLLGLIAILGASVVPAQPPDCTGISEVVPFAGNQDYSNQLTAVRVASGLNQPVGVTSAPGDTERLFVVEHRGMIKIVRNGVVQGTPFLDLDPIIPNVGTTDERGLLGLAFHPDYQSNGYFFVYHSNPAGNAMLVSRFSRINADQADIGSQKLIITIGQPFSNHNGGTVEFGPNDGYLYLATGDGGASCDVGPHAQDITNNKLGKMLRLDIDVDPQPYAIPPDNPYVGVTGDDEIWAYGLRNPFRFSFDRIHGTLMIGDVGQNALEEVDCAPGTSSGGENYGWDRHEGNPCPNPSCGSQGTCNPTGYVAPVAEYATDSGDSVIGGYVYQGCRMPGLRGTYFYANYNWNNSSTSDTQTFIHSFRVDENDCSISAQNNLRHSDLKNELQGYLFQEIAGFGEDQRGEPYFVDMNGGELFKILPILRAFETSGPGAAEQFTMSATNWNWEDLAASSGHIVTNYKVYRSDTGPLGVFDCVFEDPTNVWPGGDPAVPPLNEVYYYLVVARDNRGQESRAGFDSNGNDRAVNQASTCP